MAARKISPGLKMALELGPVLVFFAAYVLLKGSGLTLFGTHLTGFLAATAIFIPVLVLATGALWALTGHLAPMQIATLVLVLVFGGLSLWFRDPRFIKMKPTMIYLLFAGLLAIGMLRGKSWLQLVLDGALPMRPEGWAILTRRFIGFFVALALANEVIWRNFSDSTWVNFKTFGLPLALVAFFMAQSGLIARYGIDKDGDQN